MRKTTLLAGLAAAVLAASAVAAAPAAKPHAPPLPRVVGRIAGPDGTWDYIRFDAARHRLYVGRNYGLMTIDLSPGQVGAGKVTAKFAEGGLVHSTVLIPGTDWLVTTNSADNTARVISAVDGSLHASIPVGDKPDGAVFDPASGRVFVINGDGGDISVIDPATWSVVGTVAVGGSLEFAVVDGKGRLYVNSEERNDLAVIDTHTMKRIARYALPGCEAPTGLALNRSGVLISACANRTAVLTDAATGRHLGALAVGRHPDAVVIDEARDRAFIPCGDSGYVVVVADAGSRRPHVAGRVITQTGAKTAALDPQTGALYLPTAVMDPPATPGGRPIPRPGTFEVLVVR